MTDAELLARMAQRVEAGQFTIAAALRFFDAIPEGAMRVAPGSDAIVWRTCPDYKAEL